MEEALVKFSKTEKNTTYSMKVAGRYDYVFTISVENNNQLKDFVYDLKEKFSEIVTEITIFPLFEMSYHAQLAENFLE